MGDKLAEAGNRPSGFDYIRVILATAVVCSHAINVCYGPDVTLAVWQSWFRPFLAVILAAFFSLSGFLVAGSLERCRTLISFSGLRVLRLMPALVVDTLVAAFLIGPIFTTFPLKEYFASPMLHLYGLNIVGDIHYFLPGVFGENPAGPAVNGQLWTIPYELYCYIFLTGLSVLGIARNRNKLLFSIIASSLLFFLYKGLYLGLHKFVTVPGPILVFCFLFGVCGYIFRYKLIRSNFLFFVSIVASYVLLHVDYGDYFSPIPIVYATIYLGTANPRRLPLIFSGDYSYGIFLYGFPIQQAVAAALGPAGRQWYINLAIALPTTVMMAVFSWWCVERPSLSLKRRLRSLEERAITRLLRHPIFRFLTRSPTAEMVEAKAATKAPHDH